MKIIDFMICDDIRQEIGNKFTLVGVYDSDLRIQTQSPETLKWPLPINLAVYCRIQLESKDEGIDAFEMLVTHDDKELANLQGRVSLEQKDKTLPISARMPGFPLPGPGLIKFHFRFSYKDKSVFDDDASKTIRVSVEKADPRAASQ